MSHHLLSQIENGCNGIIKFKNGKIVFELDNSIPRSVQPSAPPLIEEIQLLMN